MYLVFSMVNTIAERGGGGDSTYTKKSGFSLPDLARKTMGITGEGRGARKAARKATGGLKDSMKGGTGAMSGYDLMIGGVCQGYSGHFLLPQLGAERKTCITQEFGTVNIIAVGQAVARENYAHFHGTALEKELLGRAVRAAFYVDTPDWRHNVVRRGLIVLMQTVHFMSTPNN